MTCKRHLPWWLAVVALIGMTAARADERAVSKEVLVAAPIAAVWASWTTAEGIQGFFAPEAVVEPRPGGAFHIHIDPYGAPGSKGADDMRFLALQQPTMLSFDWNAPPSMPEVRQQRTVVIVRLADVDGKSTRVSLHHTGWGSGGEWDKAYTYFDAAWGRVLGNLQQRHAQGPLDWTGWLATLRKAHEEADKAATAKP